VVARFERANCGGNTLAVLRPAMRIRAAILRRNIGADNAGNAKRLSHFFADPGEAPPPKSSAIITTLAQRVEISLVAQTGLQFDPRIAQRTARCETRALPPERCSAQQNKARRR
jgi:hypothetical protein